MDKGGTAASPSTVRGNENFRVGLSEIVLVFGRKLDHAKILMRIAEGGKDFSGDAEIGVVHVPAFFGLGKSESELAEVVGGQGSLRENQHKPPLGQRQPHGVIP